MAVKTGTFDIGSLLATQNLSAVKFGMDTVEQVLRQDIERYNALVQEALADICSVSQDRQRVAGSSIGGNMLEADEYARVPTQKDVPSYLIGFPMRKYQFAVGWTRQWEKKKTPADYALSQLASQSADMRRMRYELQKAIYTPTNSTFKDVMVDQASLNVKAFINADSSQIQNGPNGEVYDGSTHTHYDGSATLTAAALLAEINDVVEHGFGNQVRVHINQADEAAVRALSGFTAYLDPRLTINANANQATKRVDITRMDNRAIGIFGAAEVWVKPWAVANYAFVTDVGSDMKPLVMRTDPDSTGLHLEAELETFPLRAQYMEHVYGFGAWSRLNGAVLQFNNATYAAPTLTY